MSFPSSLQALRWAPLEVPADTRRQIPLDYSQLFTS